MTISTPHTDLPQARALSSELIEHVRSYDVSRLLFRAPVIDQQISIPIIPASGKGKGKADDSRDKERRTAWSQTEILGWNKLVQSLERLDAGLRAEQSYGSNPTDQRDSPLPPVLSSITLWKAICTAPTPITGVRARMGGGGKGKDEGVVDVACRGGTEWIKLWTKKEAQLMAEFREQDSYITSDWSDSDPEDEPTPGSAAQGPVASAARLMPGRPKSPTRGLTNSLIVSAKALLGLAQTVDRPPGTPQPTVTFRLTRLPPDAQGVYKDSRIPQTFDLLRSMGIQLQFGDLTEITLSALPTDALQPKVILPSLKINLDPTALVGLCCDGLHHPVPVDEDEARRRYFRPRRYLHESSNSGTSTPVTRSSNHVPVEAEQEEDEMWLDGYDDRQQSQHSRELFKETLEEMRAPLIAELRDTLDQALAAQGEGEVEFWATEGALRHLKEAMGNTTVVGHGMEQQRMRRLIGAEEGDFFEASRYQGQEGCLAGIRLRIFPEREDPVADGVTDGDHPPWPSPKCADGIRSFHHSTAATCRQFLSEYHAVVADPTLLHTTHAALPSFLRPDRLPVPKVADLSVPLPIVSLAAMQRGAEEGMTTLCMGNVVWRELFAQARWKVRGWTQGNWEVERARARVRASTRVRNGDTGKGHAEEEDATNPLLEQQEADGNAVIWLMPYRSLGEGKRTRFEQGNYAFPLPR